MYAQTVLWVCFLSTVDIDLYTSANGIYVLANISNQTGQHGNNVRLIPVRGNSNRSEIHNVTSNTIDQETTTINSTNGMMLLTRNTSTAGSIIDVLMDYDGNAKNATNSTPLHDVTSTTPSSVRTSTIITIGGNNTTTSPSHRIKSHHSKSYVFHYILIPIGCFAVTFVISFFLLRHIQRVRRKRRLERELFRQYSYGDVDELEQQMTGDFESVIDTQFVAFNDRADKNLREDTSVVRFFIL
ncbi:uncharacterized protein LOC141863718 [Acropora palmata]|uniref:uncharacterized protein LOC141863718 n=1 Tax=Acropora palmata TaxID=6131 RepID=UPI003DA0716F